MTLVTLSSNFQVVIPRAIRERLALKPGQKLQALEVGGRIELLPVEPMRAARGFLPGLDPSVEREEDRVWTWWTPRPGSSTSPTPPTPA